MGTTTNPNFACVVVSFTVYHDYYVSIVTLYTSLVLTTTIGQKTVNLKTKLRVVNTVYGGGSASRN